jgi:hypothetical protein
MPFDAGGNFTRVRNWKQDRDNGIRILADRHDEEDDNFAGGFNLAFLRTGTVPMTGNLTMGGNNIKNIKAGGAASPSLTFELSNTTGFFQVNPNAIGVSAGGVKVLEFNTAGVTLDGNLTLNGAIGVSGAVTFGGSLTLTGVLNASNPSNLIGPSSGAVADAVTLLGTMDNYHFLRFRKGVAAHHAQIIGDAAGATLIYDANGHQWRTVAGGALMNLNSTGSLGISGSLTAVHGIFSGAITAVANSRVNGAFSASVISAHNGATGAGSSGHVSLMYNATNSGYVEFNRAGSPVVREGYIGFATPNGYIAYVSDNGAGHFFSGGPVGTGGAFNVGGLATFAAGATVTGMLNISGAANGITHNTRDSGSAILQYNSGGYMRFFPIDSGGDRFAISQAGLVGIGTVPTSAIAFLDVNTGATVFGGAPSARFSVNAAGGGVGSNAGMSIYYNRSSGQGETEFVAGNIATSYIAFGIHSGGGYAERVRIKNDGTMLNSTYGGNFLFDGGAYGSAKITQGTAAPSGGVDGDIYFQYV